MSVAPLGTRYQLEVLTQHRTLVLNVQGALRMY